MRRRDFLKNSALASAALALNPWLPHVAFINRGILACATLGDAVEFIQRIKHASAQNDIIGGPQEAFDFEGSANKVSRYEPLKSATRICHTNHPLVNDD